MISNKTKRLIDQNSKDLEEINHQRQLWMRASLFVIISVAFLIAGWEWIDHFNSKSIWGVIVAFILILSVNWWYWTMRIMARLIDHQKMEFVIIAELLSDIKEIRNEVRYLVNRDVDNSK